VRDEYGRTPHGHLAIGGCDALELARKYGTPLHVLDSDRLNPRLGAYQAAVARFAPGGRALYATKALCTMALCRAAHDAGLGLDVCSGGEIYTALKAGVPASDLYLHGNNKTAQELRYALEAGVGRIIVDNFYELELLEDLTRQTGRTADIWLRLTPGIEPHTHKAIQTGGVDTKFGFGILEGSADRAVRRALEIPGVKLHGFHSHIGSQIFDLEPFALNARTMVEFAARMRAETGFVATDLDLGGGLGIRYTTADQPPSIEAFVKTVSDAMREACHEHGYPVPRLFVEPGRSIVGPCCVTLYTVGSMKSVPGIRNFASVDGGMFENPRTALYQARYEAVLAAKPDAPAAETFSLAGRCCESGDVLIWEARLPQVASGDVLAVFSTGAYNYSMASNYNRYPRPAMVLAEGGQSRVIVERETYEDLLRNDVPLRVS